MAKVALVRPENHKRFLVGSFSIVLLLMIGIAVLALSKWPSQTDFASVLENIPDVVVPVSAKSETKESNEPSPDGDRMTAELITITARGIEPSEIRRSSGPVLLAIVRHPDAPVTNLRLERLNGETVRAMEMPRNRRRISSSMTLPAGRYRLVDTSRLGFSCDIEITP